MRRSWRGPREMVLWWRARAGSNCSATHAHGYKYFDADALCQDQMVAGQGRLLPATWRCQLDQNPALPFHLSHPDRVVH